MADKTKYQVKILHPNSYKQITRTRVFTNKKRMLDYIKDAKDFVVEVREKRKGGEWEWNEKYSHD